ncbi:hypothetical protein [Streptomyces mirabilis]|uniref:hypothetical protein n=1 Tax=Streptomyces mirabilis TaxID=68239 RepID=UPI0036A37D6C
MSRALNRRVFLASSTAVASGVALRTATAAQASTTPRVPDIHVRAAALDDPTEATLTEAVVLMRRGKLTPRPSPRRTSTGSSGTTGRIRRTRR